MASSSHDPLSRRTLLERGAAAAGGLLGLLSSDGLSALADSRAGVRSPREVNRLAWPMSCDTMVALPDATTTGTTVLGKNSDRPVFDCQPLVRYPAARHASGSLLQLEYRAIPQAPLTHATVGSSPYWCWGYEEGVNEFGVAIGNEAIFTKTFSEAVARSKAGKPLDKGLLGMDLLRLGLERGSTARQALDVITDLVQRYGQWGSGVPGMDHETGGYDNSYIIADGKEAWILETVGTRWVAKKVTRGVATISNQPSIRNRWDLASHDLVDYAIDRGWWPREKKHDFDFARAYIDLKTPLQLSQLRVQRSNQLLCQKQDGDISPRWVMRVLRDHYEGTFLGGPNFNAALPDFLTLCMHSSPAGFTWGNTASSAVFLLPSTTDRLAQMWWTPVTPCTGLYIPVFAQGGRLPQVVSRAGSQGKTVTAPDQARPDTFSEKSYWWQFRDLLDRVKGDETGTRFRKRQPMVRKTFDLLERRWLKQATMIEHTALARRKSGSQAEATRGLDTFTDSCVAEALETVATLKSSMDS